MKKLIDTLRNSGLLAFISLVLAIVAFSAYIIWVAKYSPAKSCEIICADSDSTCELVKEVPYAFFGYIMMRTGHVRNDKNEVYRFIDSLGGNKDSVEHTYVVVTRGEYIISNGVAIFKNRKDSVCNTYRSKLR